MKLETIWILNLKKDIAGLHNSSRSDSDEIIMIGKRSTDKSDESSEKYE